MLQRSTSFEFFKIVPGSLRSMSFRPSAKCPASLPDSTLVGDPAVAVATPGAAPDHTGCANSRTPFSSPARLCLDRRALLIGAAAAAIGATAKPVVADEPSSVAVPAITTEEIGPGIFIHRGMHALYSRSNGGDIANCGVIIGEETAAVIDTGGTYLIGEHLASAIAARTDKPVRFVINTHMHPDHVFGNAAFEPVNPAFIAHHKMARGLAARAERYLAINRELVGEDGFKGTRVVMPTVAVEATQVIDLGNRRLILEPRRTAHTDNDLTVRDETTGIMFAGDLIFSGHCPSLDGSILGWRQVLDDMTSEAPTAIVPGHGPARMSVEEAIAPMRKYLDTVIGQVRAAIAKGLPLSRAVETVGLELKDDWELFSHYHGRNVSAAYAELEWE